MPLRCVPDEPLPPYTYVPGRSPHPTSDPRGHSFGRIEPPATPLDPETFWTCRAFLRGVDLFNAGCYWEAHEAWEAVWHAVARRGPVADFLKGLIKLAAAGVKTYEGRSNGVASHARRALHLLKALGPPAGPPGRFAGLDLSAVIDAAKAAADNPNALIDRATSSPCPGLIMQLHLALPAPHSDGG